MPRLNHRRLQLLAVLAIGLALAPAATAWADFTLVLIPDTQNYAEKFPETYLTQTRWIRDIVREKNVKFAIHLGDIVQHAAQENQWKAADRAHRVLDGRVPYSVLPGNHDGAPGKTTLYNKYFPPERFENCPWYGGHRGDRNDNNYCLFTAAGMKFLILSLEYNPRPETLDWADDVLEDHRDRRTILVTHAYMRPKGRNETGDRIFNALVRKHDNVFMVASGHVLGVGHQCSLNDAGGEVHEILCDYQGLPNGGDGWLQTLRFVPGEDKIYVEAYSPLLDRYNRQEEHTYTLDYDMIECRPTGRVSCRLWRMGKGKPAGRSF